jgi:hypothetical protein
MKVNINNYIKRDSYGNFMSGQVFFESLVKNKEAKAIPSHLTVNLSKGNTNPSCDTSIKFLQGHNAHAGTFSSHTLMREYVNRVMSDITEVINSYNMEQEETTSIPSKLDHAIIEDNEDLSVPPAPSYALPEGMFLIDMKAMQEMTDMLMDMGMVEDEDEDDG